MPSPIVIDASYHAKRVLAAHQFNTQEKNSTQQLRPFLTSHASNQNTPILVSCNCPTLHTMAEQVVQHLPGKSLDQLKNEYEVSIVGGRSTVAMRHTVLRENVLPLLKSKKKKWSFKSLNQMKKERDNDGYEMNITQQHSHCYDLVEESLLAMMNERMPSPRRNTSMECFSPTLGGHFAMYSSQRRNKLTDGLNDEHGLKDDGSASHSSMNDESGWLRMQSPSSYFLFGDDRSTSTMKGSRKSSFETVGLTLQYAKEAMVDIILGNEKKKDELDERELRQTRPTTYLQLLDMYGNREIEKEEEQPTLDDWLDYVDAQTSTMG